MSVKKLKIGDRRFHIIFGWCTVLMTTTFANNVFVDVEADQVEYYIPCKGYVRYNRCALKGNIVLTSVSDLKINDKQELTGQELLKQKALDCKLNFFKGK